MEWVSESVSQLILYETTLSVNFIIFERQFTSMIYVLIQALKTIFAHNFSYVFLFVIYPETVFKSQVIFTCWMNHRCINLIQKWNTKCWVVTIEKNCMNQGSTKISSCIRNLCLMILCHLIPQQMANIMWQCCVINCELTCIRNNHNCWNTT
jgi:hypothetical protein